MLDKEKLNDIPSQLGSIQQTRHIIDVLLNHPGFSGKDAGELLFGLERLEAETVLAAPQVQDAREVISLMLEKGFVPKVSADSFFTLLKDPESADLLKKAVLPITSLAPPVPKKGIGRRDVLPNQYPQVTPKEVAGFERIKQEKEAEERRKNELIAAKQAKEVAQQQREARERELHAERKKQAQAFHEESRVGMLIDKLKEIISAESMPNLPRVDSDGMIGRIKSFFREDIYCNTDGVVNTVSWDGKVMSTWTYRDERSWRLITYRLRRVRQITVETCPDGTIIFHAGFLGRSKIPLERWRHDTSLVETSLVKAYKHSYDRDIESQSFG